jgi:hypothetical protein
MSHYGLRQLQGERLFFPQLDYLLPRQLCPFIDALSSTAKRLEQQAGSRWREEALANHTGVVIPPGHLLWATSMTRAWACYDRTAFGKDCPGLADDEMRDGM